MCRVAGVRRLSRREVAVLGAPVSKRRSQSGLLDLPLMHFPTQTVTHGFVLCETLTLRKGSADVVSRPSALLSEGTEPIR